MRPSSSVSVLFSEPKIPQLGAPGGARAARGFQCSSASRKFLKARARESCRDDEAVSVLFSEPKIPQLCWRSRRTRIPLCFSALQRAENSSTSWAVRVSVKHGPFQCSSASRKFLNRAQRARESQTCRKFQCSSASRKFLNGTDRVWTSARASVSVLFSEPKIPQLCAVGAAIWYMRVSVLFSEPKIPQRGHRPAGAYCADVSVLFSEPKIPQRIPPRRKNVPLNVSVLFSEPKIPQLIEHQALERARECFSALQRAENSSTMKRSAGLEGIACFSALQRAENSSNR